MAEQHNDGGDVFIVLLFNLFVHLAFRPVLAAVQLIDGRYAPHVYTYVVIAMYVCLVAMGHGMWVWAVFDSIAYVSKVIAELPTWRDFGGRVVCGSIMFCVEISFSALFASAWSAMTRDGFPGNSRVVYYAVQLMCVVSAFALVVLCCRETVLRLRAKPNVPV